MRSSKNKFAGIFLLFVLCWAAFPAVTNSHAAVSLSDADLAKLVRQAYLYTFPVHDMYRTRYEAVYQAANPKHAAINHFFHSRGLADHNFRDITQPNNDTPYSSAWLDLAQEPVIISVPDTAGRYYVLALMDFYTNNFSYIGQRVTGTQKGDYLVAGPGWTGQTPAGMPVIKSPTHAVWILGRTLVADEADLSNVHKIQDQYKITRLSAWKGGTDPSKTAADIASLAPDPSDPWNYWQVVNLGMTENPPPKDEAPLLAEFARIGVGPGQIFDPKRFTESQAKIVLQTMDETAKSLLVAGRRYSSYQNGWSYSPSYIGNFGKNFEYRAVVSLIGLGALEPAEAAYATSFYDRENKLLSGQKRYLLRFKKEEMPPVTAFWSLTMYETMKDMRGFFTANPINRFSIGDRTRGVKYNEDGSLDIYIQRDSPGKGP